MNFKYSLQSAATQAIMLKRPIILIEGKTDRPIYNNLVKISQINAKVHLVNEFRNTNPGCEGVINAIVNLQDFFNRSLNNIKFVLGIIDQDARPYRVSEINQQTLQGLFILKYYSLETYFSTTENIKRLAARLSYIEANEIPHETINFIEINITNSLEDLYYLSLEALKNACLKGYNGLVRYEIGAGKVCNDKSKKHLMTQIASKKQDLAAFAQKKGISIKDLKQICKGKWYLYNYLYRAHYQIKQLSAQCRLGQIPQCSSCKSENPDDCLYTLKSHYTTQDISKLSDQILNIIDHNECSDIIQRIKELYSPTT